jgi:hypothetical protein
MTVTAYFTIGNTDDKLGQYRWASYVAGVNLAVDRAVRHGAVLQFHGASGPTTPWQNASWCVQLPDEKTGETLRNNLRILAAEYRQDSIAWAQVDQVELLAPAW